MKKNRLFISALCLLLCAATLLSFSGCGTAVKAADLMDGMQKGTVARRVADDRFTAAGTDLALQLFKATAEGSSDNLLISPLSIWLALSMTANGAKGETLSQMETLLGSDIKLDELNEYLNSYTASLKSDKKSTLSIANSIWFRSAKEGMISKDFLQKNADYYGAAAYSSPFDKSTVNDINNWVKQNTDGMIEKLLDGIDSDAFMYIINAMAFEAEWSNTYTKNNLSDGTFTDINGAKKQVKMMSSEERRYVTVDGAKGFLKDYKGAKYSFAAFLPDEDVPIGDFIASLDAGKLKNAFRNETDTAVHAWIPKFRYSYDTELKDTLSALGMSSAFDGSADFSGIAGKPGEIFIDSVIHKTFIAVDELGTRAGAVTSVSLKETGAAPVDPVQIYLDRPFVYMIIDNETKLPLFIGAAMSI